jgi:ligand-binding sensor domain-containing protein
MHWRKGRKLILVRAILSLVKSGVMRFVIWIGLLLQSFSLFAQSEYANFSRLDTYNGLSHNQVTSILKDPDGFVWFGTMSGLNRYDGYSCRIFRKNYNDSSSLLDNSIQTPLYLVEILLTELRR